MDSGTPVLAPWLTGPRIGLRAPVREDAGDVAAWCGDTPLPLPDAAEEMLVREERVPWGKNPAARLMIVAVGDGSVVGSIIIERTMNRTSQVSLFIGGRNVDTASIQRDVVGLVVPWLLGEIGLMTVKMRIPADETSLIEAVEAAGLREAVRLREFLRRDTGRVDMLIFERVNDGWGHRVGEVPDA